MGIKRISTVGMSHDEWLEVRRKTIGGSDAGALCGLNPYSSPYSVYADKLKLVPPVEDNEAMRQGRDLEQYVAERFSEETGKKVRRDNSIIYNSDYPFAHADLDRVIVGEDAGLECKTASPYNNSIYAEGRYPDHYYVQCMHYLMVTGKSKWYLAVLVFQRGLYIFEIERDEKEIAVLAEIEQAFYENSMIGKMEPHTDGAAATTETINEMFAHSEPDTEVDLGLYQSEIDQFFNLKAQSAEIKKLMDEKLNAVKAFMKEAERGICGDHKVSWKTQIRNTLDKKRLAQDHPEIDLSKYMKQSTSRPFKIT